MAEREPRTLAALAASLRGRRLHVAGLAATECTAFLRALSAHGVTGAVVHDLSPDRESLARQFHVTHVALPPDERAALLERLLDEAGELRLGPRYLEGIDEADVLFVSQAWDLYPANGAIAAFEARHPERLLTLMDLMLRLLPCPVVGVTGTNGKTTTTSMLVSLFEAAEVEVAIGGNHRYHDQLLPRIDTISPDAVAVLEVSHKHLLRLDRGPSVAVVTNVTGDHLDQLTREEYEARKARLVEAQRPDGIAVLSADDPVCRRIAAHAPGRVIPFSAYGDPAPGGDAAFRSGADLVLRVGEHEGLIPRGALRTPGLHNVANALAALAAASPWTTDARVLGRGLREFRGVRHRLEYMRRITGVPVWDDSASTSPAATAAAVEALAEEGHDRVVLVAGGDDKNNDWAPLARAAAGHLRAMALLPGTASDRLQELAPEVPVTRHATLREAIEAALAAAEPGDALLVSPAGAGFFARYADGSEDQPGLRALIRKWGR